MKTDKRYLNKNIIVSIKSVHMLTRFSINTI